MRILQVAARGATLAQFVLPLMERLCEEGATVEALCGDDGHTGRIVKAGFRVHEAPMGHTLSPFAWFGARRFLADFLENHPYEAVHTHGSFVGIAANDVILPRTPVLVYTQHGFYVHEGLGPLRRRLWLALEKRGLKHANKVICVSQAERDLAVTLGVGGPEKFVAIPGAGVETGRFRRSPDGRLQVRRRLRDALGLDGNASVLLTVSRLTWDKGYREIIAAVRQLRSEGRAFAMLCAGSGRDEVGIRKAVEQAGVGDCLTLLGWRNDVADLYCAADAFVFASHREGLPIAPIEAMATGLPVVLSSLPGCREILADGQSGLLYPVGDTAALTDSLRRLLTDGALRANLASHAVERARAFDLERVLDLQMEVYREFGLGG